MAFNSEDKITLEELSPSLQNLIKNATTKDDLVSLSNRADVLINLLNNIKFAVVDKLTDISSPVNGKDLVVTYEDDLYKLYFYNNNRWNVIPTATINLNKEYTIKMIQNAHQVVTAKYNGAYYTSSFKAKVNYDIELTIEVDEGYIAGELNHPTTFTVVEDTEVYASGVTPIPKYTVTVEPKDHENILVSYNGTIYTNENITDIPSNGIITVDSTSDYGWNKGDVSVSSNASLLYGSTYLVQGDINITITEASRKSYTVTIPGTNNQTITFRYRNSETGVNTTDTITTLTKTYTMPYGSTYTASASGSNGYLPGALSSTSGTVTADMSIEIGPAQKTYNKLMYEENGSYSWTAPIYITKVHAEIAGAGGGCHSEIVEEESETVGYFNGGNGELLDIITTITPGNTYTIIVGKAGVSYVSSGGNSTAFGITANGGGLDGTDAGNGNGGHGDTVSYSTGNVISHAVDGYINIEYGTNIEKREVTV